MPGSRFPPIVPVLLLIAVFLIYGIILWPGHTFAGMDFLNLGYPRVELARGAWVSGHIPLWNWYEWAGAPLLATMLGAVLYPGSWLAMALPLPAGLQFFVFAHLLLAAAGAWAVARKVFQLPNGPAIFTAVVYVGNAFFAGRIEQFQVVAVCALLPWLLLSMSSCAASRRRTWAFVPIIWALMLLAGHPQFAILNLLGAVAFSVIRLTIYPQQRLGLWIWHTAGQTALGTLMAAAQLLPTFELGQLSERIWPYADPTSPELAWRSLPALVVPHYYNLLTGENGRVMGYTELGLYAGIITLPLALVGGIAGALRRTPVRGEGSRSNSVVRTTQELHTFAGTRSAVIAAAVVWMLAIWFALGKHGGLAPLIFKYVPFFTQSRGAARSLNVAALMMALLAGVGLVQIQRKSVRWAVALVLLTIIDLASANFSVLKSSMVAVAAIPKQTLLPAQLRTSLEAQTDRIYRFMAFDSDLYQSNAPAAVAERALRLQPNMNTLERIGLVDGYEEGLLPTRNMANLLRAYNRNLRGPEPDSTLLAALGSSVMLTEYPLSPSSEQWRRAGPDYRRPRVVPSVVPDAPAVYSYWESTRRPARLLDLGALFPTDASRRSFENSVAAAFPTTSRIRVRPEQEMRPHPWQAISPQQWNDAAAGFESVTPFNTWNRLDALAPENTTAVLAMMPVYPGWKLSEKNPAAWRFKPLNSISYLLQLDSNLKMHHPVRLVYSPFSFRLGLFLSLAAGLIYFLICSSGGVLSRQAEQSRQEMKSIDGN